MEHFYQAYLAYERRVERGELTASNITTQNKPQASRGPVMDRLGDLLILTGLKLKHRAVGGKPMAWSPLTGSKQ